MPEQIQVINGWSVEELEKECENLRHLIELSNRGKSNRRKGANYENAIAKKIKEKWNITLVRTPLSGGFQKKSETDLFKGDLNCIDPGTRFLLHPECKKHQTWSVGKWWKQTEEDCPKDKIPLLVMHRFQKIEEGKRKETAEDFVMLKLEDFLLIVDESKVIEKKGEIEDAIKRDERGTKTRIRRIKEKDRGKRVHPL